MVHAVCIIYCCMLYVWVPCVLVCFVCHDTCLQAIAGEWPLAVLPTLHSHHEKPQYRGCVGRVAMHPVTVCASGVLPLQDVIVFLYIELERYTMTKWRVCAGGVYAPMYQLQSYSCQFKVAVSVNHHADYSYNYSSGNLPSLYNTSELTPCSCGMQWWWFSWHYLEVPVP